MRFRRAVQGGAVAAMVLAATITLPIPTASAASGDWFDTSFASQGVALLPTGFGGGEFTTDSADRLYVTRSPDPATTHLRRLTPDGAPDSTFAADDPVVPGLAQQLHADAGGTITLVTQASAVSGLRVSRFSATGAPDASFGTGGFVNILASTQESSLEAVAVLDRPGGGLLIVVSAGVSGSFLVALTGTGAPDSSWGTGSPESGVSQVPGHSRSAVADGAAVVVLCIDAGSSPQVASLLRLTAAGAPDTSFAPAGRLQLSTTNEFDPASLAAGAGAYFVVGTRLTHGSPSVTTVAKVRSTGSLDPDFGTAGFATGPTNACNSNGHRVVVSAGRLVVQSARPCGTIAMVVDRFTAAGALDPTFGAGGELAFASIAGYQTASGTIELGLQSTGRVVMYAGLRGAAAVVRLRDDEAPPAAGTFVPLTPARILDTRNGTGAPVGAVPGGGSVDVQVTGRGGVPADGVGAVVVNVTVTQPSGDGNIVAFPTGTSVPLASNVNYVPGQTVPNLVTVKVGAAGGVTLRNNSTGTVQLVADVAGYYRAGSAVLPGTFTPLNPARILDTRTGTGGPTGPIAGGGSVDLQVTGQGGVPSTEVAAVVMNVTVTQPTWDGNVVAYPSGAATPLASNLNFAPGQTIPNLVMVMVGVGGKVTLKNNSTGTVQLLADVAGYYRAGTAVAPGAFVPVTPKRVVDTRTGPGTVGAIVAGASVEVPRSSFVFAPAAVVMNVTVTQPTWDGSVVAYPKEAAVPLASNLNFVAGQTVPNLVIARTGALAQVALKNNSVQGTVHLVVDVCGYFLA
jgi:uncharacterized delta-60 repeat protein